MNPQFSQSLKLVQKQILNQEMKLSLDILAMDVCTLREFIVEAAETNPFIEVDLAQSDHSDAEQSVPFCQMLSAYCNETDTEPPKVALGTMEEFRIRGTVTVDKPIELRNPEPTFFDMLEEQIRLMELEERVAELCVCIVGFLNEKGYLEASCEEIARACKADVRAVEQALRIVQTLSPTGVGAQSLEECLLLQLRDQQLLTACTRKTVEHGLQYLARNDYVGLAKLLGCSARAAVEAAETVRSLNPIPSQGFRTGEESTCVIPDASVRFEHGTYVLATNRQLLPRVTLNSEYCQMVDEYSDSDMVDVRGHIQEAKAVIRGINNRRSTILDVLQSIVLLQPAFFRYGEGLKPMEMQDVARILGVHLSTVSRAVSGKYIMCKKGTVSLRSLFERGIPKEEAEDNVVSVSEVKQRISNLIAAENCADPLSDKAITDILCSQGYRISRRTTTKYREQMRIPVSYMRRKSEKKPF